MAIDPICGMTVDEKTAAANSVYKEKTYYFCSRGCKVQFEKRIKAGNWDPEKDGLKEEPKGGMGGMH
jgi:YHS domain-containing protein